MSSNCVKNDSVRIGHRRLGHLKQVNVVTQGNGGILTSVQDVRIGQDHTNSSTKRYRNSCRGETGKRVHRHGRITQRKVTISVPVCNLRADHYTKFVFCELPKAKVEALASLKKFVVNVGTQNKLIPDNAKECLPEQIIRTL